MSQDSFGFLNESGVTPTPVTLVTFLENTEGNRCNKKKSNKNNDLNELLPLLPLLPQKKEATDLHAKKAVTLKTVKGWPNVDEQIAIHIHEHGLSEAETKKATLEALVEAWQWLHPATGPGVGKEALVCAGCEKNLGSVGLDYVPLADGAWIHHRCNVLWRQKRKQQAIEALVADIKAL